MCDARDGILIPFKTQSVEIGFRQILLSWERLEGRSGVRSVCGWEEKTERVDVEGLFAQRGPTGARRRADESTPSWAIPDLYAIKLVSLLSPLQTLRFLKRSCLLEY